MLASSLAICTCQVPSPEQLLAACSVCSCVGAPPPRSPHPLQLLILQQRPGRHWPSFAFWRFSAPGRWEGWGWEGWADDGRGRLFSRLSCLILCVCVCVCFFFLFFRQTCFWRTARTCAIISDASPLHPPPPPRPHSLADGHLKAATCHSRSPPLGVPHLQLRNDESR